MIKLETPGLEYYYIISRNNVDKKRGHELIESTSLSKATYNEEFELDYDREHEDILFGLVRRYLSSINRGQDYLTTSQFVQGLLHRGLKTELKVEMVTNYVTYKPEFSIAGEKVDFEEFIYRLPTMLTSAVPITE